MSDFTLYSSYLIFEKLYATDFGPFDFAFTQKHSSHHLVSELDYQR